MAGPDSSKYGIYREYTFKWNQIEANNVFRLCWDVGGETNMKDYISSETARCAGYLT